MKLGWKFAIAGILIVSLQLTLRVCAGAVAPNFPKSSLTITSANGPHKFVVEVATTEQQKEYGLMFRKTLDADKGMIFVWKQPLVISMWMKNTEIPLDMVFLDGTGKVTHVVANAKPESLDIISSVYPVNAVIELAGGTAQKLGIAMGDSVESPDLAAAVGPAP